MTNTISYDDDVCHPATDSQIRIHLSRRMSLRQRSRHMAHHKTGRTGRRARERHTLAVVAPAMALALVPLPDRSPLATAQ